MAGLPWYLLAFGIALVVLGAILAVIVGAGRSDPRRRIHSRMTDDEIARKLKDDERVGVPAMMILAGLVCALISVVWRIGLWVVNMTRS